MKLKIYCNTNPKEKVFGFDAKIEGHPKKCLALLQELEKALSKYVKEVED